LRLQFHDLEKDYPGHAPAIVLFTKEMARRIKGFIDNFCLINVVVNCEAGISRSAAVAAALSMHFNKNCDSFFNNGKYIPNRLVYKTLLDELNGQDNKVPAVKIINREIFFK
jgi:hypothetical protein